MPNHYDIDIWCEKCGAYVKTIYPYESVGKDPEDRLCKRCAEKLDINKALRALNRFLVRKTKRIR